MKRDDLFVVSALTFALGATSALGQDDTGNRGDSDLNVSITLEGASQSRGTVANLELPIEQGPSPTRPEQERRFEPADFARPNRLESIQIAADDLPRRTTAVAVRCQAFIGRDSSLGEYHCVADDNRTYEEVVQAVIDAVPTQRFVAARVDGENRRVLMNFALYVDCSSGSCLAVAARNHGYHIENLGLDYVDPQPIVEGDDWYAGFDYKLRWVRDWMPRIRNSRRFDAGVRYVIAAEIDADGIATSACLYWVGVTFSEASRAASSVAWLPPDTKADIESAIASLGEVHYVPGMIDGTSTPLRLFEATMAGLPFSPGWPPLDSARATFSVSGVACD
jgi:hypothetical protein